MGGEMATVEAQLAQNEAATENGLEVEITSNSINSNEKQHGQNNSAAVPLSGVKKGRKHITPRKVTKQVMGQCKKCGYLSSQEVCKACVLLEGLNKNRPKNSIEVGYEEQETEHAGVKGITEGMKGATIGGD